MNKTIKSLSLLKVLFEKDNSDYLEIFIPFIASLMLIKKYKEFDLETICKDFSDEYGLNIPYHPMQTILRRCKTRKILKKNNEKFEPITEKLHSYDISTKANEYSQEIDELIRDFIKFAKNTFNKIIEFEEAERILIAYLKDNDEDILFAFSNISLLPEMDAKKEQKYILNKYVKLLYDEDYKRYKVLTKFITGYILANCIFYDEPASYKGQLNKVKIYFDTRVILRLVGLEGEYRERCYNEFILLLKEKGASLSIFEHTYDEIIGIIDDCEKWIQNPSYRPNLASPVLKHFVENNYSKEEVSLFASKVNTKLKFEDIETDELVPALESVEDQIDNEKLFNIIKEIYKESNITIEDGTKDEVIYKDVKSISSIYKIRKGKKPKFIKDSKAIFITTNSALAKANTLYNKDENNGYYRIRECLTDIFLGTTIWIENPANYSEFQEKKIIANCISALEPDDALIKKFATELKKREHDNSITANELYFLKTHKVCNQLLSDKTLGDSDNFYDKLPEEILEEIKSRIKTESDRDYMIEFTDHKSTKTKLRKRESELVDAQEETIIAHDKVSYFASTIAKWSIRVLFGVLLPICLLAFILNSLPNFIDDKRVYIITVIVTSSIGVLSGVFGISVKWVLKKLKLRIENWIQRKILD